MATDDATVSLLDRAKSLTELRGPECSVAAALRLRPTAHEPGDLSDLLKALARGEIRYSNAEDVCKAEGIGLTADTLSRHTRRKCACP